MSKALATKGASLPERPSYLPEPTAESRISNIQTGGQSMPGLSLAGRRFALKSRRTVIQKWKVPEIAGVILDTHAEYQRAKHKVKYDPNDETTWGSPMCFTNDSETPDELSPEPQSDTCANCQWNSSNKANKDLKLDDKCGIFRNTIVLLFDPDDESRTCLCRLRVSSTSCFGEEDQTEGLLNFDTMLKEFSGRNQELFERPVLMSFDENSNYEKLHFTILDEYIDEVTYGEVTSLMQRHGITPTKGWSDYTSQTVYDDDSEDSDGQSGEGEAEKAPKQRATKKTSSNARKKEAPAEDEEASDDESEPAPSGNRSAGRGRAARGRANTRGAAADDGPSESEDGGSAGAEKSGDLSEDAGVQGMLNNMNV